MPDASAHINSGQAGRITIRPYSTGFAPIRVSRIWVSFFRMSQMKLMSQLKAWDAFLKPTL